MSPVVERALREAFGDARVEGLVPLAGGRSGATLLSFDVGGRGYVLRHGDPSRSVKELVCMQIASSRGIAPALHYVDDAAGLSIMDRVATEKVPRDEARTARLATALRTLHEGPDFPPGPSIGDVIRHFETLVRERTSSRLPDEIATTLAVLDRDAAPFARKPCHLDLNPGNVLETSTRVYFVDWEIAGAQDPYLDIAQLGVFSSEGPAERLAFLAAYLERSPTEEERARLHDARIRALCLYSASFFVATAMATGRIDVDEAAPSVAEALASLTSAKEKAPPGLVASALFAEMRRGLSAR